MNQDRLDPIADLGELALAGGPGRVLGQVVDLALAFIEVADLAALLEVSPDRVVPLAHTSPRAEEIARVVQEAAGLDPAAELRAHPTLVSNDISSDPRWPQVGQRLAALGVCSLVAYTVGQRQEVLDALVLYSSRPAAFSPEHVRLGAVFAAQAGLVLTAMRAYESTRLTTQHLRVALESRDVIGQAKGIIMAREGVGADEAFDILRRVSQHLNRKLRDVARDVVRSVETEPPEKDPGT